MRVYDDWDEIIGLDEALKGWLAGSLICAGILIFLTNIFYPPLESIGLIIIGILVFLDALLPFGKQPHVATEIISLIIACIITFIFSLTPYFLWYLSTILVIIGISYLYKLLKKMKK